MKCKYGNDRCWCQTCKENAAYEHCSSGYCINNGGGAMKCSDCRQQIDCIGTILLKGKLPLGCPKAKFEEEAADDA